MESGRIFFDQVHFEATIFVITCLVNGHAISEYRKMTKLLFKRGIGSATHPRTALPFSSTSYSMEVEKDT